MADETKLTAATRLEKLLDNIAGGENEVTPATRLEKFLSYIADAMEGGGGSGGGGCECELPTYLLETSIANAKHIPTGSNDNMFLYIDGEWKNLKTDYNYSGVNAIHCAVEKPLTNNAIYLQHLTDSYTLATSQIAFEGAAHSEGETAGFYFTEACSVLMVLDYYGDDLYITLYTDASMDSVVYVGSLG